MKIIKKLIPELVLCSVISFLLVVTCCAWCQAQHTERLILGLIIIGYITPFFIWWIISTIKEYKKLRNPKLDGFVGIPPHTYQYSKKRLSFFDRYKGKKL